MNISLKRGLRLRNESALTVGNSLALILYLARRYGGAKVKDTSIEPAGMAVAGRHGLHRQAFELGDTDCRLSGGARAVPETRVMQFAALASDRIQ